MQRAIVLLPVSVVVMWKIRKISNNFVNFIPRPLAIGTNPKLIIKTLLSFIGYLLIIDEKICCSTGPWTRHISDPSQERAASASRKGHRHKDADSECNHHCWRDPSPSVSPRRVLSFLWPMSITHPNISLHYRPRRWLTSCRTTARITGTTWVWASCPG